MAQASAEKLEQTGPAEKERVASVPESSRQVRRSRLCQKEKEQSRLSRVPDRKMAGSQGEREPHLGEREERVESTVKKDRSQGGKGGQATRASLEQVEGSMSG